jgi:threonine dehydrogenase-like Zn-dependent dehydrogenase
VLALQFTPSVARHVAARVSGRRQLGGLQLVETDPPLPPADGWVQVRPRLSGICGSDQALVTGDASPYLGALTSAPFVPGHEVVGELRTGERVVVEPALGCHARGVPSCPECGDGHTALCRHVIDGDVAAGLQVGFCRDTSGGWSEGLVAHASQVHAVPDALRDEDAVLVEPLACSLHAARMAEAGPGDVVVVIGAGTIGLLAVAAVRDLAPGATVLAVAKHPGQQGAARRLGADAVCAPDAVHREVARLSGARRLVGRLGDELLLGGADAVLDCVGSSASLQAAVTATRARGTVVLVGMPGRVTVDLALAWQRELRLLGAYGPTGAFPEAIELAGRLRVGNLVDDGFALEDHRAALDSAPRAARSGRVKTVFDLREGGVPVGRREAATAVPLARGARP